MNAKQVKFAELYYSSGNATQSAIQAGYSSKTAYSQGQRLLKNVEIREYLQQLTEQGHNDRMLSAMERQELLSEIAKSSDYPVAVRIRAIDVLNKMTGEYIIKTETTVETTSKLAAVFAQLTTDELRALAEYE